LKFPFRGRKKDTFFFYMLNNMGIFKNSLFYLYKADEIENDIIKNHRHNNIFGIFDLKETF
jgi:hypothetical protein